MTPPEADSSYGHLLAGVAFRPVFIIGDHRSGTTLLYRILAATRSFHVLTAYDVIYYGESLSNHLNERTAAAQEALARRFADLGLANRILDGVPVRPDLPEEYGFLLEDNPRPQLRPANLARFDEMCRKLRLIGGSDKPILLKNPWDVLNFVYLKERFPRARLIFIHRHPLAVINSQLRAIRSMLAARNEYIALIAPWYRRLFASPARLAAMRAVFSARLPVWTRIVPRHVHRAGQFFLKNVGRLPPADYFSLRYEQLCQDPCGVMERLLRFLDVTPEGPVDFARWIEPRGAPLLPEVEEHGGRIMAAMRPYLAYHHYEGAVL